MSIWCKFPRAGKTDIRHKLRMKKKLIIHKPRAKHLLLNNYPQSFLGV